MAKPLRATSDVFRREDRVSKVEFLPIPNVLADYMLNLSQEVMRTAVEDMWEHVVGILRLEGLAKTYREATDGTPATGKLNVLHPGLIEDGETFEIYGVVFEYDKDSSVSGGNVAIDISTAQTVEDVRVATEAAINGSSAGVVASPTRRNSPAAGSEGIGNEIDIVNATGAPAIDDAEAQVVAITDNVRDERFTHIGMRSSNPIYATGGMVVPAPSALVDGETITIPGDGGPDVVLELDRNSSVESGNVLVDLTGITTDAAIRDRLVTAINLGTGDTSVAATAGNRPARGYLTALSPSRMADGATFTLDDGAATKTFEIDKDSNWNPANVRIDLSAAADMQDVRAAIIAAINAATGIEVEAFNRGFGARIELTNTADNGSVGNRPVTHTVSDAGFLTGDMEGGAATIKLTTAVSGTSMNREITHTVSSELFSVEGMSGGIGAGWDITPGHCAFRAFDVVLDRILRCPAVVGKQNHLKVRIRERLLDEDSDPEITAVSGPGITVPKPGPNQYRWEPEVIIEAADAAAPELEGQEVRIIDGVLAEFDATDGQTIVYASEVEVRGTKFGRFLEPQDVTTKVSKNGDTMTGNLVPDSDNARSLGVSGSSRWNGFFKTVEVERTYPVEGYDEQAIDKTAGTMLARANHIFASGAVGAGGVAGLAFIRAVTPASVAWGGPGAELTIYFGVTVTVKSGESDPPTDYLPLSLAGAVAFSAQSGDVLTLVLNPAGTFWTEKSRSVNHV